jgi:hypothetical protein
VSLFSSFAFEPAWLRTMFGLMFSANVAALSTRDSRRGIAFYEC